MTSSAEAVHDDAVARAAAAAAALTEHRFISLGRLTPSPTNPRKHHDEVKLNELADSVRSKGVLQPLLVRPIPGAVALEIVAGHRRWIAAQRAGLLEAPCLVRDYSDAEVIEIQVIENAQREDVLPYEEGAGYKMLLDRGLYDVQTLAAKVGKSLSHVYGRLKLLDLCEEARVQLADPDSKFTVAHALIVGRLSRPEEQRRCVEYVLRHWRPVKPADLRDYIADQLMRVLSAAPFSLEDAALVAEAGPCIRCEKRTNAQAALFAEVCEDDRCMDIPCYDAKVMAHARAKAAAMQKRGQPPVLLASERYGKGEVPAGVLDRSRFHEVIRGESKDGAQKVVMVDGPRAGEAVWVKLRQDPPKKPKPPSQEREKTKRAVEVRLAALIAEQLIAPAKRKLNRTVPAFRLEAFQQFFDNVDRPQQELVGRMFLDDEKASVADWRTFVTKATDAQLLDAMAVCDILGRADQRYPDTESLVENARGAGLDVEALRTQASAEVKAIAAGEAPKKKAAARNANGH